ncbi:cyclase family protein [Chloroflexota bacterium]
MSSPKIYDVSLPLYPGMPVWPGDAPLSIETVKSIAQGHSSNVSLLHLGSHSATHVDAPRHFLPDAPGVDAISPQVLIGRARLLQLTDCHHIDAELLEGLDLRGVERLLIGTRNSALLGQPEIGDYAYVSADAARYLVRIGLKLVGIDYLSIEEYHNDGHPTHHILLGAGIVIIEGLDLARVPPGDYELFCLPLKIKDADGAPARVFLRQIL